MEQYKPKGNAEDNEKEDGGGNGGMGNALKFLLLAAGCGLVILLITVAVLTAKKGEDDTNSNLDQYSSMAADYEEVDLKVYNNNTVMGSEIKELIKEYADSDYLSIKVVNGKGNTTDYINASTITDSVVAIGAVSASTVSASPADIHYINDGGTFSSEVLYDQNGVVACLRFTQQ